jgi:TetR/AcrR family transcriptional regulator, regulator of cefoperazone and chloramphenicol sensitivity
MPPAARRSRRTSAPAPRPETRDRLIAAAAAVFAERGYRGATMREIADRSGANLAAAHYHFGSKQDLYREVVRAHFERLAQRLAESGAAFDAAAAARLSREQLVELLRARVRTMLESFLEPTGIHATLMQRELADPSETLPVIVRRWIDPLRQDMVLLLQRLAPKLSEERLQFCVRSLMGQVIFYFTHRPALLLMMRRRAYPPGFVDEVTEHVVAFTLGGLDGVGQADGRKRARKEALQEWKP